MKSMDFIAEQRLLEGSTWKITNNRGSNGKGIEKRS